MAGPSDTGGNTAGWFLDPTGRHQYRYWSGSAWTDRVSDNGVAGIDPVDGAPAGGAAPGATSSKAPLFVFLGVVAVVAIVAVVIFAIRSGSGGTTGMGTFDGEVAAEDDLFLRELSVPEGSVIVLRADPDADFDPILGVSTTDDGLTALYDDFFGGSSFDPDAFSDALVDADPPGAVMYLVDHGGAGAAEDLAFPAPYGGDFTAMVSGYRGSTGEIELEIGVEPFAASTEDAQEYLGKFFQEDFTG